MQRFIKLIMNSLCGENVRRDIDEEYKCESEYWMNSPNHEIVLDYWRLPNGESIVILKQDDGLESDTDIRNTMAAHLGTFILRTSKTDNG